MSRLIDADDTREEVIATLRDCFNVTDEVVDTVVTTINNMTPIDPEPHWIPVTERLPVEYDNSIEFLCTLEDNDGNRYVDLILWTGCDWENNYTDDNEQNKYGIDKVVGWMFSPIPMRKGDVTE